MEQLDPAKQALYQQLANAMAGKLAHVPESLPLIDVCVPGMTGTETEASPEALPNTGAAMLESLFRETQEFNFYKRRPENPDQIGHYVWKIVQELDLPQFAIDLMDFVGEYAQNSKWSNELTELEHTSGYDMAAAYAALNQARKEFKDSSPINQLSAVTVSAYIAAFYQPEDVQDRAKPKKHKKETDEHSMYRHAIRNLREFTQQIEQDKNVLEFKYYINNVDSDDQAAWDALYAALESPHPGFDELRESRNKWRVGTVIRDLMKQLTDESFRSADFRAALVRERQTHRNRTATPDTQETQWTILPPGTMEEIEATGSNGGGGETKNFVDPERMKWLAQLAISWGPDAYIAVANLDAAGNYDYRVAVLPQEKDGQTIEHAVAENPASGNAIYAYRAETGVDDTEGVWLTWKDVYHETKTHARALGARRILHGKYVDENVYEYLTRPVDELDRPGYKR